MANEIRSAGSAPPSPNINSPDIETVTIQKDETTLMQVAERLGISEELLRQANPQIDPKLVSPGQEIKIPGADVSAEVPQTSFVPDSGKTTQSGAEAKLAEQKFAGLARQSQLLAYGTGGPSGVGGGTGVSKAQQVDQLGQAIMDGNEKEVERLITKGGVDPNGQSTLGWTPLTYALTADNDKIAELLLKHGAKVDQPMVDGHTALTMLAKRDSAGSGIDFLISHGANVNHQDNSGKTALKHATENGRKEFVDTLLQNNADPDIPDYVSKRTPLMEAAKKNDKDIAALLGPKTKKPDLTDVDGNTALTIALAHTDKTPEVIKTILDAGADPNKPDAIGHKPIWLAAKKGDSEAVKALIDKKAKVDIPDTISDSTPLAESAKLGDSKSVKALLDANANPNVKDKITLRTPLMDAAASGDTVSVKLLLDKKANPNAKDKAGLTPLHEAALHGDDAMMKAVLDKGGDPNAKDVNNRTPLMEVAAKGNPDMIVAMKEKKADLNAVDTKGRTALIDAVTSGNKRAVAVLVGSPDYKYQPPFVDFTKNKQGDIALDLAKKALQQPTIDTFDKSAGKPGITEYERQNLEAIVQMLEAAKAKKP